MSEKDGHAAAAPPQAPAAGAGSSKKRWPRTPILRQDTLDERKNGQSIKSTRESPMSSRREKGRGRGRNVHGGVSAHREKLFRLILSVTNDR